MVQKKIGHLQISSFNHIVVNETQYNTGKSILAGIFIFRNDN